ncbi:MAG: 1-acyl-sn-glycerol-3-phosphate acyltransferase, partial [Saezia sp.]
IAKAEVKKYPVIGRIARNAGTLFLDRTNIKDAIRVSEHISQSLEDGHCIAFFPEATTSEGEGLLPLHPSLFEGALRARSHVQTVVLRYHLAASTRAAKYAAYVHTSLLATLWHILRYEKVHAMVTSHQPFQAALPDTRHGICTRVQMEMEGVLSRLNYNPDDLPEQYMEAAQMHLQFSFIDDALPWLMDAQNKATLLSQKVHHSASLMELRQLVHLVKGGAASVGFTQYSDAAKVLELCLSRWIKTKEKMSTELHDFIAQALEELRQWQTQLPQGDIAKEQVEKLLLQAKERIPLYDISEQMVRPTVIYNPVELMQKGSIELVESQL